MRTLLNKPQIDYGLLQGKRICVVEDDADQMAILRALLKDSGCETTYLRSGKVAMQWLMKEAVDLILIDVIIPDLDGWEVCARLRERGANRATPIIFTTCVIRRDQERLMSDLSAHTVTLAKPIKRERLFEAINKLLDPKDLD